MRRITVDPQDLDLDLIVTLGRRRFQKDGSFKDVTIVYYCSEIVVSHLT